MNHLYKLACTLNYTKSPPVLSTFYDLLKGIILLKKLHKKNNYNIIHCRGYITGILGLN